MEAIKRQARQFREQVAKQQQAVLKQFGGRFGTDTGDADEADHECHEKLRMLYSSTRAAKHFQRDMVRGIEGLMSVNIKQMEISKKLAEDCCKYGNGNPGSALAKASDHFGNSHKLIETERENLLKVLGEQVFEPLRGMIMSAPLEDARHLTYRYERIRQDVDAQAIEVQRRELKTKEPSANAETSEKLEHAESRLSELRSTMSALGREATTAMESVENQQQQSTFQQILTMVDAERSYHQSVASILDQLYREMVQKKQQAELMSKSITNAADIVQTAVNPVKSHKPTEPTSNGQTAAKPAKSHETSDPASNGQKDIYFIAEVIHSFDAQADGELNLSVGDYVVVRKVSENGWSEGECNGNAGWFPSAYVIERDKVPASKLVAATSPK